MSVALKKKWKMHEPGVELHVYRPETLLLESLVYSSPLILLPLSVWVEGTVLGVCACACGCVCVC